MTGCRDPPDQIIEAERKECAVTSPKVEFAAHTERGCKPFRILADHFQKWQTISRNGVLHIRRGCRPFPKVADHFSSPESGLAPRSLRTDHSASFRTIKSYAKRGGEMVYPLAPTIASGSRCQTGRYVRRQRFAQKRQKDLVGSCSSIKCKDEHKNAHESVCI